jgi:hypothetical protein
MAVFRVFTRVTARRPRLLHVRPASVAWGFSGYRSTILTMSKSECRTDARIAVSTETREMIRNQKRGGETYNDLLRKMAEQYDPRDNHAPQ